MATAVDKRRSEAASACCIAELERLSGIAHAFDLEEVFESICASLSVALPIAHAILSCDSGTSRRVLARWPSGAAPALRIADPDVTIVMRRARGLDVALDLFLVDCDEAWDRDFTVRISVPVSTALSLAHVGISTSRPPPPSARDSKSLG